MKQIIAFVAAVLIASAWAPAVRAQAPSLDARVNIDVADRSVDDLVRDLRERSGANVVVLDREGADPVSARQITIQLSDVAWRDALELVAEKAGAIVEVRAGGVLVVTVPHRTSMSVIDQDIRGVIEAIATGADANVVIGKEVAGTVSLRFNNVPWREALEVTAKTLGFVVVEERYGVLRVVDPRTLRDQLETRTYQLRYLRPKSLYKPILKSEFVFNPSLQQQRGAQGQDVAKTFTVLQALEKGLSEAGRMDYIDSQNVIIVRDTSQVHESFKNMLARLDIEPLQVFCDVKFVSTTNGDVLNLGVDYGDNGPQIGLTGGQIPITFPFNAGSGGWDDSIIASPNGQGPYVDPSLNGGSTVVPDTIFGSLSFTQFQATLRLLQRDRKAEVMQAPKIIALDGHEATIFVGETIRYAEAKSEQGQSGGLQLSVTEAQGSPVEVGFQLLIRPNVIPGTRKIVMEVIPKETSLSGLGNSALAPPGFDVFTIGASGLQGSIALPRTRSSTIVTTMMLDSGQTAVIGGLTTDSDTQVESRVPYLADIPLLGALFRHESRNRERRSLLVFLTPTLVHSAEDTELLLQQELQRRNKALKVQLDELFASRGVDPAQGE